MRGEYAYDGEVIPVEEYHVLDGNATFCGISVRPLRWRFSEQLPLTGTLCELCCELGDVRCSRCQIPLHALVSHAEGRCSDELACATREALLKEAGRGWLISPEGVTELRPEE